MFGTITSTRRCPPTWPSAERAPRASAALTLLLACAPCAAAPVLYLSNDPRRAEAARALERRLERAGGAVPFVLPAPALGDPRQLAGLLDAAAPRAVAAPGGLPPAAMALLNERGLQPADGDPAPAEEERPQAAAELRESAALHLDLGDDLGAWRAAGRLLERSSGTLADVELIERLARVTDSHWSALEAAGRLAALPGLRGALRARALRGLAAARRRVGDGAGEREALESALGSEPGSWEARLELARALREEPQEALPHAREAARSAPRGRARADALRLQGELLEDLGDAAGARRALEASLRESPGDLETLTSLARALRARPAEAASVARRLDAAAGALPQWCRASADRRAARLWLELGAVGPAVEAWRRVLELAPDDGEALEGLLRAGAAPGPPGPRPAAVPDDAAGPDVLDGLAAHARREREAGRFAAAVAAASRFHEEVGRAPSWRGADGYRLAASLWGALGYAERAARAADQAQALDWRSMATALALVEHQLERPKDGEPTEFESNLLHQRLGAARAHAALGDVAAARRNLEAARGLAPRALSERAVAAALGGPAPRSPDSGDGQKRDLARFYDAVRREAEEAASRADAAGREPARPAPPPESAPVAVGDRLGRARLLLDARDLAGAQAELEAALGAAPRDPEVLALRVTLLRAQGRRARALAAADELVAVVPRGAPAALAAALRLRAAVRREDGDAAGERADLEAVLDAEPQDMESLGLLVDAARERPADALALVEAHAPGRRSPKRAAWLALRGLARSRAGDAARARRDLDEAVALDAEGVCARSPLRLRPERLPEPYFDACLARFPRDAGLYSGRAALRFIDGRREGAAADLRKALELRPGDPDAARSLQALGL